MRPHLQLLVADGREGIDNAFDLLLAQPLVLLGHFLDQLRLAQR